MYVKYITFSKYKYTAKTYLDLNQDYGDILESPLQEKGI